MERLMPFVMFELKTGRVKEVMKGGNRDQGKSHFYCQVLPDLKKVENYWSTQIYNIWGCYIQLGSNIKSFWLSSTENKLSWLQAWVDQPARKHFPLEDKGQHKQWGGSLVCRKEMCQEVNGCSWQVQKVESSSHHRHRQDDLIIRQCRISASKICQESATSSHGPQGSCYDVPIQNLITTLSFGTFCFYLK